MGSSSLLTLIGSLLIREDRVRVLLDEAWYAQELFILLLVVLLNQSEIESIVPEKVIPDSRIRTIVFTWTVQGHLIVAEEEV